MNTLGIVLLSQVISLDTERLYQSTQINLNGRLYNEVTQTRYYINKADVIEFETCPHITLLYGIKRSVPAASIREIIENKSPFSVQFGAVGIFSNPDFDVLYVSVMPNKSLSDFYDALQVLPNENTHPNYKPHITLAYMKKGLAKKYLNIFNPLQGKTFNVKQVTISRVDYVNEIVSLGV